MPIEAMAVANREEMQALYSIQVRCKYVTVLIHLIGVIRNVAHSCGESKLRDYVKAVFSH